MVAVVVTSRDGRLRVALVFGGRSPEHAISCISAGSVWEALDPDRYDVVPVGITLPGRWVLVPDDPNALALSGRELPAVAPGGATVALSADPTRPGLVSLTTGVPDPGPVDVVFPVLHGPYGEDGTVQGLLELADLPYVGSGVLASAAVMDKAVAKLVFAARGLPLSRYLVVLRQRWLTAPADVEAEIAADLGFPVFVKPANLGSSVGISKVKN